MRWASLCAILAILLGACEPLPPRGARSSTPDTTLVTTPASSTAAAVAPPAAGPGAAPASPPPSPPPAPSATRVSSVQGFSAPQAVLHDSVQDIYFVSNVSGSPTAKGNAGFISRVRPDGAVENLKFIAGGQNGVTLHAPKGLALAGDTLWVVDLDAVRGFDRKTGAPRDSVSLAKLGAVFLDGVAVAPTGAIYLTDTGIRYDDVGNVLHPGPDRIFRIGPDRQVTVAAHGDTLGRPTGIAVDLAGKRFVVASFGGRAVYAWKPGDKAPQVLAKGAGAFDGVAIAGTRILASSWNDSSVSSYETGQEVKLVTGVPNPGGIGYDRKRNRVLVPIVSSDRVEIWQLP